MSGPRIGRMISQHVVSTHTVRFEMLSRASNTIQCGHGGSRFSMWLSVQSFRRAATCSTQMAQETNGAGLGG